MRDKEQNQTYSSFVTGKPDQLKKLSQEHDDCLVFADELSEIASSGSASRLEAGIQKVLQYNETELEEHFQHEEQTILGPLIRLYPEHRELCIGLGKEHGYLRTLVEQMTAATAASDLAEFARVLKAHTVLEETELFPLIEKLFSKEQLDAVMQFTSLVKQENNLQHSTANLRSDNQAQSWLAIVAQHFEDTSHTGGHIVLFPRYRPDLCQTLAKSLDLGLFDFQKEVMHLRQEMADRISLEEMQATLLECSRNGGYVCHNLEALLSVKTESERREWLLLFLETEWPNPIILPITVFQADVPEEHENVCDLELHKMPKQSLLTALLTEEQPKYDMDAR